MTRALGVGLLLAAVVALVRPLNSWFVFDPVVVWAATAAAVLWLVVAGRHVGGRGRGGRAGGHGTGGRAGGPGAVRQVWLGTVVGTVLAAAHAVLALVPFGWDARRVFHTAQSLAAGQEPVAEALTYFARYPNNLPLLAAEDLSIRAGDLVGLPPLAAVLVAQVLCVAVVLWALGRAAVELAVPRLVLPVQALATVLLGLSPNVAVPYTDVPAAAAVAVTGLAMARCHRRWSWWWAALGLLALAVGILAKPYVLVVPLALALVVLWPRRPRAVALLAAGGVLLLLVVTGLDQLAGRHTGLTYERLAQVDEPFPPEHFLAMGTWDSRQDSPVRRWGAYRQDQVDATAALPPAERAPVLRAQVRDQIAERGLGDNLVFFGAKAAWVWGDGTFWAHGESRDGRWGSDLPEAWAPLTAWTQGAGTHYALRGSLVQGVWLGLLLVTGWRLVRARLRPDTLLTTWCVALGGLTAYLVLFEARPRYVWALLPLVLLTWLATSRPERATTID